MRELKFRAWDGNSIRYDVTGFEHGKENEMAGIFLDGDYFPMDSTSVIHKIERRLAVVMQYTGLKDKNGQEIYEGDIVYLAGTGNCKVGTCPILGTTFTDIKDELSVEDAHDAIMENNLGHIAGNIYENPELLEGA